MKVLSCESFYEFAKSFSLIDVMCLNKTDKLVGISRWDSKMVWERVSDLKVLDLNR